MTNESAPNPKYVITWQIAAKAIALSLIVRILLTVFPSHGLSDLVQAMIAGVVGVLTMFSLARTKEENS